MHPLNPALPSCPTLPSLFSGPAQEQQLPNPAQDSHHPSKNDWDQGPGVILEKKGSQPGPVHYSALAS